MSLGNYYKDKKADLWFCADYLYKGTHLPFYIKKHAKYLNPAVCTEMEEVLSQAHKYATFNSK